MDTDRGLLSEELVRAVDTLADVFAARSIRYALIGGLGISMRGRPRLTQDVDFLVDVPRIALPGLLDDLVERGFSMEPAVVINQYVREHITAFVRACPSRLAQAGASLVFPGLGRCESAALIGRPFDPRGVPRRVDTDQDGLLPLSRPGGYRDPADGQPRHDRSDAHPREWAPFAAAEAGRTAWLEAAIEKRVVRRE